ncbi:helix-turn-helix transcriptional regulator [Pedobacter sp. PLR]|uniref:helix-turn-helix domain-containing protein n=1 Tax=Pedobacter sp. PLR TaxID=2994465 RepID=UPI002245189F|nr:helix-turn-helix transcriptional regulator [Pedobacter sp. PLR]MCX2449763.1 helix-turn-helix transcriptional regulator [Pedobacter sp. PLR]
MNIVDRIRKIRVDKGISQETVAEYLKISQSAYSKLESQNMINVDQLLKIAKFFDVEPGDLVKELQESSLQAAQSSATDLGNVALLERVLLERGLYQELLTKRVQELEEKVKRKDRKIEMLKEKLVMNNIFLT